MQGIRAVWNLKDDLPPPPGWHEGGLRDRILASRGGIELFDEAAFGELEHLPGAIEAGEAIVEAFKDGKQVAIHGDYDADGIAGSVILHSIFNVVAPDAMVPIHIPHRIDDGYGLSRNGLLRLREEGIDLVVSVDCGITSVDEIKAAKEKGLEVIVTDHHEMLPNNVLPKAKVVVHPRLEGATCYPWLAGAGVAWSVARAVARAYAGSESAAGVLRQALGNALPFAAIGTIADVVELLGENRAIAKEGLARMLSTTNIGLKALLVECGANGGVDEEFIKFQMAPRINALGRLGSAQKAIDLFLATDPASAAELARELSATNTRRRALQDEMMTEASEMVAAEHPEEPSVIVLAKEGWRQGLCGPAASKVAERFNCPVLLLEACPGGVAKGSARSIEGISIRDGLVACDEILTRYGGHAAAAGLTVATARVGELRDALEAYFRGKQRASVAIQVDCRATLEEVGNLKSLEAVRELAPFGPGNREPMVLVEGVEHIQTKWIGSDEAHLKLRFKDRQGRAVDAIWFRASEFQAKIKTAFKHGAVDLVVEPGINSFAGARTAQMRVVDMREAYKVTVEPEATSGRSSGERSSASRAVDA